MAFVLRDFIVSLIRGNSSNTPNADLTSFVNVFTSLLSGAAPASGGGTSNFLRADGTWAAPGGGGGGSVTSVALADASTSPIYTISGSPVTTSGTLTLTLSNEAANAVFAGPTSGGSAQPTFRGLVIGDIPTGYAYSNLTGAPSIPTGANPSGSVGLSAVNGSAATFLRSDGAPALSQAIAPTWTGQHTFNNTHAVVLGGDINTNSSAGTTGQVLVSQGSGTAPKWGSSAADFSTTNIQTFTQAGGASQTYTVPSNCQFVLVYCIGGGGGGGGAQKAAAAGNATGGGGGGGGGVSFGYFPAAILGGSVTLTFSNTSGGAGGPGTSTAGGNGTAGTAGSSASFGGFLISTGGGGGSTGGGGGAVGAGSWFAGGGPGGAGSTSTGGSPGTITTNLGNTAGGGGGGIGGSGTTQGPGGAGQSGSTLYTITGGSAGAINGGNGGVGTPAKNGIFSAGGGGGGANITSNANGGTGGNGSAYGAGGGGGGASIGATGTGTSGSGGTGGAAAIICIAW